jgi:hypothetical protein
MGGFFSASNRRFSAISPLDLPANQHGGGCNPYRFAIGM